MRKQFLKVADFIGARNLVQRGRDRMIDALTGDERGSGARRNSRDDFHFKLLLWFSMGPGSNYLDVGANRGKFLKGLDRLAPKGHHIAYEPVPELYRYLAKTFQRVDVRQAALSDVNGVTEFVHVLGPGDQGYSSLRHTGHSSKAYSADLSTEIVSVTTERLDDKRPADWLPNVVKIDVEGAEHLVFRGAMDTFRSARPVIAFEHVQDDERTPEIFELVCKDLGLRLFNMDGVGPLSYSQFQEQLATRWNWVAHE